MEPQHSFGVWLKRRRKGLDLTQAELARMLDCSMAAVRKFESEERRPSAPVVDRLMVIFDIPVDERTSFLKFARGDWYFSPGTRQDESFWQVQEAQSPPDSLTIPPLSHPARRRTNLPAQLSSFIGRERELAEVHRLLESSRLVTLTGAGGSGKTRLALRVAGDFLNTFKDGVWLVELAPLADPALVPSAIVSSLGIVENENRSVLDRLRDFLYDRQVLLVIDNCEHLVEAVAFATNALLSHCPGLSILATSREPLGIVGETVWPAPILTMPPVNTQLPVEALGQYDAVRLFSERAKAALPNFSLTEDNVAAVVQLCHRLDGIPLAIELAAARVKLLRVEQIVERLDDRFKLLAGGSRSAPPRHQTLQALIDWSHHLLSPVEQMLYRRLAVFAGSFTLEAVEAVCDPENAGDVFELLTQLVNKSLVTAARSTGQEARYNLHETIRQHARADLEAAGEVTMMQERHAEHYCRQLEERLPRLHNDDRVFLHRQWLETEYENLRSVMVRSLDDIAVSPEWGIRVVTRLIGFWNNQGLLVELRRWLDAAVERAGEATSATRAELYMRKAALEGSSDDPQTRIQTNEALHIFRQLNDKEAIVLATVRVSIIYEDLATAISDLEQVLIKASEAGDVALANAHYGLSWVSTKAGLFPRSIEHLEKALLLARSLDNRIWQVIWLRHLSYIHSSIGDYERAITLAEESLALAISLDARKHVAEALNLLGETARLQHKFSEANGYYRKALAIASEMGDTFMTSFFLSNMGTAFVGQGDLSSAATVLRESTGINRRAHRDNAILSWNLRMFTEVAERNGDAVRAACLQGAAESLGQFPGFYLTPADIENIEGQAARVRSLLGEEAYSSAWLRGRGMSLDEIFAYALEESS